MHDLSTSELFPRTEDGWRLHLTNTVSTRHLEPSRRPVVIVPGYGMNGFIFGFHPRGTSLTRHLAESGLEVWVANLRGQGRSAPLSEDAPPPSLRGYAEQDLTTVIRTVLERTSTTADRVDILGASLGGSIAYAHMALERDARVGAVVTVGSPLRWVDVPLLLRLPFSSPRLAGLVRVNGARRLAGWALPVATRVPGLLSLYMNISNVDLSAASQMIQTVEDPHPRVNSDIAKWLNARDMILRGVNITNALTARREPLLIVLANRDGIVPAAAALSVREAWGGTDLSTLKVGDDTGWYAHADLFVGHEAPIRVFDPIARWLRDRA